VDGIAARGKDTVAAISVAINGGGA